MRIRLNDTYQGAFEVVGVDQEGNPRFESSQSVAPEATIPILGDLDDVKKLKIAPRQPEFEVNTVKWSVAPDGALKGTAKFLAIRSHDIVNAELVGISPEPESGKDHRLAQVKVTFKGGTGRYASARGEASVVAKLFGDGLSVGHIMGDLEIDDE